jgi:hypothetical protein
MAGTWFDFRHGIRRRHTVCDVWDFGAVDSDGVLLMKIEDLQVRPRNAGGNVSVRMSGSLLLRIDAIADRLQCTRSAVIVKLLELGVNNIDDFCSDILNDPAAIVQLTTLTSTEG